MAVVPNAAAFVYPYRMVRCRWFGGGAQVRARLWGVWMKARDLALMFLLCLLVPVFDNARAQERQSPPFIPGVGAEGPDGGRGGMMGMGRGTIGTVTATSADHFTIKTELGETYTVFFSVNTRILKQPPGASRRSQGGGFGEGAERKPPQAIKAMEIKSGDVIAASGEVDPGAKTVGAVFILLIDPERAKEMRAMEANFGKTWLAGRVTAIDEVKVTLQGGPRNETHSFVADENTTFRKRRDPITLADVQVGDMVRVEGAVKNGGFLATAVVVMGPPPQGRRGDGNGPGQPPIGPGQGSSEEPPQ